MKFSFSGITTGYDTCQVDKRNLPPPIRWRSIIDVVGVANDRLILDQIFVIRNQVEFFPIVHGQIRIIRESSARTSEEYEAKEIGDGLH